MKVNVVEVAAGTGPVADASRPSFNGRKMRFCMVKFDPRDFIYALNGDNLKSINDFVLSKGGYVQPEYIFIDEAGDRKEFDKMLDVVTEGDRIYVPSIKVFQYGSVSEFIEVLKYFDGWQIQIVSLNEPDYKCSAYATAVIVVRDEIMDTYINYGKSRKQQLEDEIAVLEAQKLDLLHRGGRLQKEVQKIEAMALYRTEKFRIDEICEFTGLSKSTLFRALAEAEDQNSECSNTKIE